MEEGGGRVDDDVISIEGFGVGRKAKTRDRQPWSAQFSVWPGPALPRVHVDHLPLPRACVQARSSLVSLEIRQYHPRVPLNDFHRIPASLLEIPISETNEPLGRRSVWNSDSPSEISRGQSMSVAEARRRLEINEQRTRKP